MSVYMYQAALYCESCGHDIEARLARPDTDLWDSDSYPVSYADAGESDSPSHCDSGAECLEAIQIPFHRGKSGALLDGTLTEYGEQYVAETCGPVGNFWRRVFDIAPARRARRSK